MTPEFPAFPAPLTQAERTEELRVALSQLHDEVVRYLRDRDLEVEHLPNGSPLRVAIERARDMI